MGGFGRAGVFRTISAGPGMTVAGRLGLAGDARLENMLRAYDQALSHPDGTDLADARAFAAAMLAK